MTQKLRRPERVKDAVRTYDKYGVVMGGVDMTIFDLFTSSADV